jgi:hypothetical protein
MEEAAKVALRVTPRSARATSVQWENPDPGEARILVISAR